MWLIFPIYLIWSIWPVGFNDLIDFINLAEVDGLLELADLVGLTGVFELGDEVELDLMRWVCLIWSI